MSLGGVFVVAFIGARVSRARKKKANLAEIGALLGGGSDGSGSAWGNALGWPATLRFVTRGPGGNSGAWTEIDVALPAGYPLALHVRHHGWFDRRKISRREMIDITFGDAAFDDLFLVEAAPADIVRELFDARVRFQLSSLRRFKLSTLQQAPAVLRLELRGWVEVGAARAAVELLTTLATGVRDAYDRVDSRQLPLLGSSRFLPQVDDRAMRKGADRLAEVARVQRLQLQRNSSAPIIGAVIFGVVILIALLAMR
jgi:hypothetical protein